MSALFHKVISLNQDYSDKARTLLEIKLRKVPGVVSAVIKDDNTFSIYTKNPKMLLSALLALKIMGVKDSLKQKIKAQKAEVKAVSEEL